MEFALSVNGRDLQVTVEPATTLLAVLRGQLGLFGTRYGCGTEACGACTVLIDGEPAFACTMAAVDVRGRPVTTLEGIQEHPLRQALLDEQAGQCGYCLAGIMMTAKALLDRNPDPSRGDIVAALDRNLCRCGAHNRIVRAVQKAAAELRGAPA